MSSPFYSETLCMCIHDHTHLSFLDTTCFDCLYGYEEDARNEEVCVYTCVCVCVCHLGGERGDQALKIENHRGAAAAAAVVVVALVPPPGRLAIRCSGDTTGTAIASTRGGEALPNGSVKA